MSKLASLRALRKTIAFELSNEEIVGRFTIVKMGVVNITQRIIEDEVAGEFLEILVNTAIKSAKSSNSNTKGITQAELIDSLVESARNNGKTEGALARSALKQVISAISGMISESIVAVEIDGKDVPVNDETRQEIHEIIRSLDINEIFDALAAFVKLNFPAAYGPFVRKTTAIMMSLDRLTDEIADEGSESKEKAA